jgi:glycosyltransferase involved in cell wall biosynthesis
MLANWTIKESDASVAYPPVEELFYGANHTGDRKIISVGRFSPIKKQRAQIELIRKLSTDLPDDVRLTIIGSTRNKFMDQLNVYAQALPIDIKYGLNHAALKKEYEGSAIFWSTTGLDSDNPDEIPIVETFGLAMAESMATGCVPIAIKGGGVSELIDSSSNGYLVSSIEEMGEATKYLLTNQDQLISMSASAREKAKTYSPEIFRKNILEIFFDS